VSTRRSGAARRSRSAWPIRASGYPSGDPGADFRAFSTAWTRHGRGPPAARASGLAIVKHVTSAHGGQGDRCEYRGAPDRRLLCDFPCDPPMPSSSTAAPYRRWRDLPGGSELTRVLVVEDEDSFSDAISYMLRKEGFEGRRLPDGPRTALETFDRSGGGPGAARPYAARAARQRGLPDAAGAVPNVPVIMLTAKGQRDRQGRRP